MVCVCMEFFISCCHLSVNWIALALFKSCILPLSEIMSKWNIVNLWGTLRPWQQTEQPPQEDWCKDLSSMPLWRSGPNTRTLPTILLTLPPSKVADRAHLCVPQNQALVVCRGFVPDIQVCSTRGREDLVTITSNAEEDEKRERGEQDWDVERDRQREKEFRTMLWPVWKGKKRCICCWNSNGTLSIGSIPVHGGNSWTVSFSLSSSLSSSPSPASTSSSCSFAVVGENWRTEQRGRRKGWKG